MLGIEEQIECFVILQHCCELFSTGSVNNPGHWWDIL